MTENSPSLDAAYDLKTPEDSIRLYADWARDYDSSFVVSSDYQLHMHAAHAFVQAKGKGPVLDVGAGTGLCGDVLASLGIDPIDATDISQDMLDQAARKDIYRSYIQADLTKGLPVIDNSYAGIVSSGTFTTGHVGPDAFDELLRIARPGALFAISINTQHFAAAGFKAKLDALADKITDPSLPETRIYGDKAEGPHALDTALIATFRKL